MKDKLWHQALDGLTLCGLPANGLNLTRMEWVTKIRSGVCSACWSMYADSTKVRKALKRGRYVENDPCPGCRRKLKQDQQFGLTCENCGPIDLGHRNNA